MDNAIVIDYGSHTTKAGSASNFPNDKEPSILTPTAVRIGSPADPEALTDDPADPYSAQRPVCQGKIADFEQFEALLHYILYDLSGWEYGDEGSIVFCEPLLTPKADREQLTQLAFEVFNVSGLFFQDAASLALYAVGKLAGCVVDIGHSKIDIASVSDGNLHPTGARRLPYALHHAAAHLRTLLAASQPSLAPHLTPAALDHLLPLCLRSADAPLPLPPARLPAPSVPARETYTLPDGTEVSIATEGTLATEPLLRPAFLSLATPSITDALVDCVYCQPDSGFRKLLFESLYVCGGGSAISGLPARVARDLRLHVPPSVQPMLCATPEYMPPTTGRFAQWIGGAVLAKVVQQQAQYLIKADYEEAGPCCVHRKC